MPKINAGGVPSYEGHEGTVTSATGKQFELNPDVEDENRTVEPIGEFDETPAPGGAGGPVQVAGDDEKNDDGEPDADRRDDASSLDLRDQKQDEKTGAAVPVKAGSPSATSNKVSTRK